MSKHSSPHIAVEQSKKRKKYIYNLVEYHLLQIRSQFAFLELYIWRLFVWGIKKRGKIFGDT